MNEENLKLVAYCGLYCPECYKMEISKEAILLKKSLDNSSICGTTNEPSTQFKDELNNLVALHCPKLCKDGGGNLNCLIRKCCTEKNLVGCWECNDFQTCKKLKEQFVNNINKIKELGIDGFCSSNEKERK